MTEATQSFDMQPDHLKQVQAALNFSTEIVMANPKTLHTSIAMTKAQMWDVSVDTLRVLPDFNIRIKDEKYYAHIRSLADSIKTNGFYKEKPLSGIGSMDGKKPVIYIADGHCRLEACRLAISEGAPILSIPVVINDRSVSMEDLTVALVRSGDGKRLSPMEISIACKRLANYGWKVPMIAEKIGISQEYVHQLLTLAGAPKSIRDMVQLGEVTAAVALGALRSHGAEASKVMSEALDDAKASGKNKLTSKFLPEKIRRKACAKAAPVMFSVIEQIKAHKSFKKLPDDLRLVIDDLIATVTANSEPEKQSSLTI